MSAIRELVTGGVLVVAVAIYTTFALLRRHRFAITVRAALADPDPSRRIAAIETLARQGAERFVSILLWRNRVEVDPAVRQTLQRVVGPADDKLLAAGSDSRVRRQAALHHIRSQTHRRF